MTETAIAPAEAKAIRERVDAWMRANNASQEAVADLLKFSSATLSQVLSGAYAGRMDLYLGKIRRWLDRMARRDLAAKPPPFARLSVYRHVAAAFERAQDQGVIAAIMAKTGSGKTQAAEHYCEAAPDTIYILLQPPSRKDRTRSYRPILDKIGAALGHELPSNLRTEECLGEVATGLRGTGRLLIVDQADKADEGILQALRSVWDISQTGVALLGTVELIAAMRRKRSPTMGEVVRRIAFCKVVGGFTADDAERLAEPYHLDEMALVILHEGAQDMAARAAMALRSAQSAVNKSGGRIDAQAIREAYGSLMPMEA